MKQFEHVHPGHQQLSVWRVAPARVHCCAASRRVVTCIPQVMTKKNHEVMQLNDRICVSSID